MQITCMVFLLIGPFVIYVIGLRRCGKASIPSSWWFPNLRLQQLLTRIPSLEPKILALQKKVILGGGCLKEGVN